MDWAPQAHWCNCYLCSPYSCAPGPFISIFALQHWDLYELNRPGQHLQLVCSPCVFSVYFGSSHILIYVWTTWVSLSLMIRWWVPLWLSGENVRFVQLTWTLFSMLPSYCHVLQWAGYCFIQWLAQLPCSTGAIEQYLQQVCFPPICLHPYTLMS